MAEEHTKDAASGRVTIRDVAREAGVSVATVSNWLNGRSSQISPATAAAVAKVASDLNYRPSSLAQGLRGNRTRSIGLIIPSVETLSVAGIIRGAELSARQNGSSLLLSNLDRRWDELEEHALTLVDRGVESVAFVFTGSEVPDPAVEVLRSAGMKVASLLADDSLEEGQRSLVFDNKGATRQIALHLWNLGHRDIGFVSTTLSTANGYFRLKYLRQAVNELGGEITDENVHVEVIPDEGFLDQMGEVEAGRVSAVQLLSQANPPTAICAADDLIAIGVMSGARDLGLRVPEDVSVVGFDDLVVAQLVDPPLTTVAVDRRRLGSELIDLLFEEEPQTRPHFQASLVKRASTGGVPT